MMDYVKIAVFTVAICASFYFFPRTSIVVCVVLGVVTLVIAFLTRHSNL